MADRIEVSITTPGADAAIGKLGAVRKAIHGTAPAASAAAGRLGDLRKALMAVSREFPLLGQVSRFIMNPFIAALALTVGVVRVVQQRVRELNAELKRLEAEGIKQTAESQTRLFRAAEAAANRAMRFADALREAAEKGKTLNEILAANQQELKQVAGGIGEVLDAQEALALAAIPDLGQTVEALQKEFDIRKEFSEKRQQLAADAAALEVAEENKAQSARLTNLNELLKIKKELEADVDDAAKRAERPELQAIIEQRTGKERELAAQESEIARLERFAKLPAPNVLGYGRALLRARLANLVERRDVTGAELGILQREEILARGPQRPTQQAQEKLGELEKDVAALVGDISAANASVSRLVRGHELREFFQGLVATLKDQEASLQLGKEIAAANKQYVDTTMQSFRRSLLGQGP